MPTLDWNPDWETGIKKIDQQHRELFRQVEALMNAIHHDQAAAHISGLLKFLANYVDVHFKDEEAEMKASDYHGLASHQAIHNDMRSKVATLLLQFQNDPTVITDSVIEFIIDWLVNHINGEDRRMAHHLIKWASMHPGANG
jgi:hemerythrin